MTKKTPAERERLLRDAVNERTHVITGYPEDHPARKLYLADSARDAQRILDARAEGAAIAAAKKRRATNQTRGIGATITILGTGSAVLAYGNITWLFWVALAGAALGVLVMVGAAETT